MIVRNNFYVCDIKIDISLGAAFLTVYKERRRIFNCESWFNTRVCVCINIVLQIGYSKTEFGVKWTSKRANFSTKMSLQNFPYYLYVWLIACGVQFLFSFFLFLIRMFSFVYNVWFIFISIDSHNVFKINILNTSTMCAIMWAKWWVLMNILITNSWLIQILQTCTI